MLTKIFGILKMNADLLANRLTKSLMYGQKDRKKKPGFFER